MKTVCNELEEVKHKAYEIGIQLGVPNSKMLIFEKEGRLLLKAIDYWLCGNVSNVPITWGSVVAALESNQVGERGCAEAISSKYCCKQEESKDSKKGQLVAIQQKWIMTSNVAYILCLVITVEPQNAYTFGT